MSKPLFRKNADVTAKAAAAALLAAAAFLAAPAAADDMSYELASALANASAPVAISTATTTDLIANGGGANPAGGPTSIYVTEYEVVASGTGTNCGTDQVALTGAFSLAAQSRIHAGSGFGPVLTAPAGDDVCAVTKCGRRHERIDGLPHQVRMP